MRFAITKPGFYRRRDGQKFEIVGKDKDGFWIGIEPDTGDGENEYTRYSNEGILRPNVSKCSTPYDAVAEWVEPKRIKGWVNVYSDSDLADEDYTNLYGPYASRKQADKVADVRRIACIEIDVLEGQGLEGGR